MLDLYHAMVHLSRAMLDAARRSDWTELVELGSQRDAIEAQLRTRAQDSAQPVLAIEAEKQLMAAILAANEQIAHLVEVHLASLPEPAAGGHAAAV
jgi:hypothetical protein